MGFDITRLGDETDDAYRRYNVHMMSWLLGIMAGVGMVGESGIPADSLRYNEGQTVTSAEIQGALASYDETEARRLIERMDVRPASVGPFAVLGEALGEALGEDVKLSAPGTDLKAGERWELWQGWIDYLRGSAEHGLVVS